MRLIGKSDRHGVLLNLFQIVQMCLTLSQTMWLISLDGMIVSLKFLMNKKTVIR